jgi:hypothetical protein
MKAFLNQASQQTISDATLRRGDTVEAMIIELTLELLSGRRCYEIENSGVKKKTNKDYSSRSTFT